jgi:hypothetical protein
LCHFYISPSSPLLCCRTALSGLLWQHWQQTFTTFLNDIQNNLSRTTGLTVGDFKGETLRLLDSNALWLHNADLQGVFNGGFMKPCCGCKCGMVGLLCWAINGNVLGSLMEVCWALLWRWAVTIWQWLEGDLLRLTDGNFDGNRIGLLDSDMLVLFLGGMHGLCLIIWLCCSKRMW